MGQARLLVGSTKGKNLEIKKKKSIMLLLSLWGPIVYGPGPFTRRESKGPSRGGLWPKPNNVKHRIALRYRRGPLSPRQTQSPTEERGKNGIGLSLKENLKYPGKAALTAIQCSTPDRAAFFGFYNHPQRL